MSAIVCGFGRFIKADDNSSNVGDMMWYRCLITVDDLADIPEHLAITLGDVTVTVLVQIDNTAPFGGDDRGIPFAGGDAGEGGDQTDPLGRRIGRRIPTSELGGSEGPSREGYRDYSDPTWDSSKIRDRRRAPPLLVGRSGREAVFAGGPPGQGAHPSDPSVALVDRPYLGFPKVAFLGNFLNPVLGSADEQGTARAFLLASVQGCLGIGAEHFGGLVSGASGQASLVCTTLSTALSPGCSGPGPCFVATCGGPPSGCKGLSSPPAQAQAL